MVGDEVQVCSRYFLIVHLWNEHSPQHVNKTRTSTVTNTWTKVIKVKGRHWYATVGPRRWRNPHPSRTRSTSGIRDLKQSRDDVFPAREPPEKRNDKWNIEFCSRPWSLERCSCSPFPSKQTSGTRATPSQVRDCIIVLYAWSLIFHTLLYVSASVEIDIHLLCSFYIIYLFVVAHIH